MASGPLFLGIDLGTSGCRAIAIDRQGAVVAEAKQPFPEPEHRGKQIQQDPQLWWQALEALLDALVTRLSVQQVVAITVDGTSSTVLLCDERGNPVYPALMYNDARATSEAERMARIVLKNSAAHGPSSSLAKLLWLQRCAPSEHAQRVLHQADWIAGRLCGRFDFSDSNNCLKMGYDPIHHVWPDWIGHTGAFRERLPKVQAPGTTVAPVTPEIARRWGFGPTTQIVAGTTDSTAAFIATGASQPGEAVTSLGSTLVMKVISNTPVFAPEYGVYSQPLGDLWLVGGGSNSGGRVLRQFFGNEQLRALSEQIDPSQPSGLDYYPLLAPGERFPVCDPAFPPRMTPHPQDDARFLHGLLEGMARIEHQAYQRLAELGTPYPSRVRSAGGGANNPAWNAIRQQQLGVELIPAQHQEAAYGAALLARQPFTGAEHD